MARLNIKNCTRCHKIFQPKLGENVCPECREKEVAMEEIVREYVRDNPGVTIREIIDGTGASEKLIWRMIRQGQFENAGGLEIQYPCGKCGKLISKGAYCDECAVKLKLEAKKYADAMRSKARAADKKPAPKSNSNKNFSNSMYEEMNHSRR